MDLSEMHKKEMNRIGCGRQQSAYSSKSTNRVHGKRPVKTPRPVTAAPMGYHQQDRADEESEAEVKKWNIPGADYAIKDTQQWQAEIIADVEPVVQKWHSTQRRTT
jgi:hypothetical protein